MPATTMQQLIDTHGKDIAYAAAEEPANTPAGCIDQLGTAAINLGLARMNNAEDVQTATTDLTDALNTTSKKERQVLINRAGRHLKYVADMVDEYRQMVGD